MTVIAVLLLLLVVALLATLAKRLVCGAPAVAGAERPEQVAAQRVACKAAAIRVLEQLDVSGSQGRAPPSSS